jgi:hypothetical protein
VPGVTNGFTTASGISNRGEIVESYETGGSNSTGTQGYTASPMGKPTADAVGDVMMSQASQISMNDLVPGGTTIGGQSGQSANWAGQPETPTGVNLGGFAFPDIAPTAMQFMPSGNG